MTHSAELNALINQIAEIEAIQAKAKAENKLFHVYPDTGRFAREKYRKHTDFFNAKDRQLLILGGNRSGKTFAGSYAVACHLTGLYPKWWTGRRFEHPIQAWCAGLTNEATRDIIQLELLGNPAKGEEGEKTTTGTGMIPKSCIGKVTWKQGIPDFVDIVAIKHVTGGYSYLGMKTYGQGRESFQGTAKDLIWFDEEPPADVYEEALTRTATTGGMIMLTFTPLLGLSKVIQMFLPDNRITEGSIDGKTVVNVTWDDVPHLDEEAKAELLKSYLPHTRDARSKGIPVLGSGVIYPISEDDITVKPFDIPKHWPRFYGMDVGWEVTCGIWGAYDEQSDIVYAYSEHYMKHAEPVIHASSIKARGEWIVGAIDPASRGRNQVDGRDLYSMYLDLGLNLIPANNSVETGIYEVWQRLSTGRLKIFNTLTNFLSEYRVYQRDEDGKILKKNDHLCDSTRYMILSGFGVKRVNPALTMDMPSQYRSPQGSVVYSEFSPF
jgi:phage terminase large subunit-like protein